MLVQTAAGTDADLLKTGGIEHAASLACQRAQVT
jgi:hypothetical protein